MLFYIQASFVVTSAMVGLVAGHGGWAGSGDPSLEFLLRAWVVPEWRDLGLMAFIGCASAAGGYAIGQAYRLSEAALVAPIEYAAIPMSVFWGLVVFGELPDGSPSGDRADPRGGADPRLAGGGGAAGDPEPAAAHALTPSHRRASRLGLGAGQAGERDGAHRGGGLRHRERAAALGPRRFLRPRDRAGRGGRGCSPRSTSPR
jgi:hypothetical protein